MLVVLEIKNLIIYYHTGEKKIGRNLILSKGLTLFYLTSLNLCLKS